MGDLISRKAILEIINKHRCDTANIELSVLNAPAVDAAPVVYGEWVSNDSGTFFCSVCDSEAYWDTDYGQQLFDFCPYCGADMRKKVQNETD